MKIFFAIWSTITVCWNLLMLYVLWTAKNYIVWYITLIGFLACIYSIGHGLLYIYSITKGGDKNV